MLAAFGAIPAIFAALVVRTDRRLIAALRTADAFTPATATTLQPLRGLARWRTARLEGIGAIGRSSSGSYFLNEAAWGEYRLQRRRRVLATLAVVLPLSLALAWLLDSRS
jgi:hypothetical protein